MALSEEPFLKLSLANNVYTLLHVCVTEGIGRLGGEEQGILVRGNTVSD